MTQPEHVDGAVIPVHGDAHVGQSLVGDFVRICCSRSHYSHIRGAPGVSIVVTGQGHIVASRVYHA